MWQTVKQVIFITGGKKLGKKQKTRYFFSSFPLSKMRNKILKETLEPIFFTSQAWTPVSTPCE